MRKKVVLGIAKVLSEEECGVPDSVLADYHDFSYESPSKLPVAAALSTRFCAWCGAPRGDGHEWRTSEVIRSHQ